MYNYKVNRLFYRKQMYFLFKLPYLTYTSSKLKIKVTKMPHINKEKVSQPHLGEQDHYKQLLDNIKNAVYEVKKEKDQFYCSSVFGELSEQLDFTKMEKADSVLRTIYKEKLSQAFLGEKIEFTFHYQHFFLHTTLKPIYKEGEVEKLIGTTMDITPFENSEKTMEYLVTHDILTGLPNRHKLLDDTNKQLQSKT